MDRHRLIAPWTWICCALIAQLTGCGLPARGELTLRTGLPPITTAWLCAEAARATFHGADPSASLRGAPVTVTTEGYEVSYQRRARSGFRVTTNTRLALIPPTRLDQDLLLVQSTGQQERTGLRGVAGEGLTIQILGNEEVGRSGSIVTFHGTADVDLPGLRRKIESSLSTAEHLAAAASLLATGQHESALARCNFAWTSAHQSGNAEPQSLRARLLLLRAEANRHLARLAAARADADAALQLDPELSIAREQRSDLERRLARTEQLPVSLRALAVTPSAASRFEARATLALEDRRRRTQVQTVALLTAADQQPEPATTRSWALAAIAADEGGTEALHALVEHQRAAGEWRLAYESCLELYAFGRTDPKLVFQLHEAGLAIGEPVFALRLLGRHQDLLATAGVQSLESRTHSTAALLPAELAVRVLASVHGKAMLDLQVLRWISSGADGAAVSALGSMRMLRNGVAVPSLSPDRWPRDQGFDAAPGVAPQR